MKMTNSQAIAYCNGKAQGSLDGTPSGENTSIAWKNLAAEIEVDGLDVLEDRLSTWTKKVLNASDAQRTLTLTITIEFLGAIEDDEEIERMLARELREKVKAEIEKLEGDSSKILRLSYLRYLRGHLSNVLDGSADLEDYEGARKDMENQLVNFEKEYSSLITEALEAQQD